MTVLIAQDISKSYGDRMILDRVSFTLGRGERAGLVGANGTGKSTLLKILTGMIQADSGSVTMARDCEWGYLPQTLAPIGEQTVHSFLDDAQHDLVMMATQLKDLAALMGMVSADSLDRVMREYGELATRFEQRGGYELAYRRETVLAGLGLVDIDVTRPVSSLSGGEKTRLGLAALLIGAPDLLLLDEPTNHLDAAMLDWLEDYLRTFPGSLLAVSHDRQFLNQTVGAILEIDEHDHRLRAYEGDYDDYLAHKRIERRQWDIRFAKQQEEIHALRRRIHEKPHQVGHHRPPSDHNKMAYNRHGAKVQAVASRNIRSAEVLLDRILADPVPRPPDPLRFAGDFSGERIHSSLALAVSGVSVAGSGDRRILRRVEFVLGRKDRVLITGPNGAGKTTLLNVIAGVAPLAEGEVHIPSHVRIGYLRQEYEFPDPRATVLEYFRAELSGVREEHIATLLSCQLFRFDEFNLSVGSLSPGQARKLMIARLLAERPNLLLLDEPTNHVSFSVMEEFERAVDEFPGPVIAVSHDRWFTRRFRSAVWTLLDGVLTPPPTTDVTQEDAMRMRAQIAELGQYSPPDA